MADEQEALRLAEEGERRSKILRQEPPDWSAMLRKLVAEREADRAAMREALEALKYHTEQTRPIVASQVAIHDLRQRLEGTT